MRKIHERLHTPSVCIYRHDNYANCHQPGVGLVEGDGSPPFTAFPHGGAKGTHLNGLAWQITFTISILTNVVPVVLKELERFISSTVLNFHVITNTNHIWEIDHWWCDINTRIHGLIYMSIEYDFPFQPKQITVKSKFFSMFHKCWTHKGSTSKFIIEIGDTPILAIYVALISCLLTVECYFFNSFR